MDREPLGVLGAGWVGLVSAAGFAYDSVGRPSSLLSRSVHGLTTAS